MPKNCNLVATRDQPSTSASLWANRSRVTRQAERLLRTLPLSAAKGTSTSCRVLSHLNASRQIFFLADRVVPHSARPCSTGSLTVRHSVKFPLRLVEAEQRRRTNTCIGL